MRKSKLASTVLLIAGLWSLAGLSRIQAQCLFNCNDTVHVSVNNMCMATITPDIILEGADVVPPGCVYGIELFDQNGSKINTAPKLGAQYIGQYVKVRLFQQGGPPQNSCWSYVLLEDKLPPEIICPPNDTIPCYDEENARDEAKLRAHLKSRIEANLVDNCGNEEISISIISNTLDRNCNGPFSAVQIVVYDALDKSLNATRCVDTIYYERANFADVDAPINYKDNKALKCYGSWDKDGDGLPSAEELMLLDGNRSKPNINGKDLRDYFLCNFKLTYQDIYYPDCGSTFKIVRKWTVIDWCNASFPEFYYQVIKVVDDRIIATVPNDIRDVEANPWTCDASVVLPAPDVSDDECSDWSWSIFVREPGDDDFSAFGGPRGMNVTSASRIFPIGKSTVKYVIEDVCGNERIDSFCVYVIDVDDPVAVCDHRTVVTLNDQYLGKVFAISFDDGSFDGCSGIVSYKVRRVDRQTSICPTPSDWDDFVKFCCADVGKIIMVELEVTDGTGRKSTCMAEAMVQFKGAGPAIICPPDPGVKDCRTYEGFNINTLPKPTVSSTNPCLQGSLGVNVRETGRAIDECGNGYIDVEWYVNFTGEEEVICSERIVFSNLDPFAKSDINWPGDRNITSCEDLGPLPSEKNNLFDQNRPCSNIFATHEDEVFDNVSGFCRKVLRRWTVIDWCQFNADPSSNTGIWTHVQKIHIENSDAPKFGLIAGIIDIQDDQNNCRAQVRAAGQATDDCTSPNQLRWTHQLDVIFGSTAIPVIPRTSGASFQRTLDVGTYLIRWEVTDHCGNTTRETQSFEVSDDQDPTPICRSGGGNLSQVSGQVVVQASELNGGSTDNCDSNLEYRIRLAGSAASPTPSLTFGCADQGVQELELWVRDNEGNSDFCTVFYEVRDPLNVCGVVGASIAVSGNVRTVNKDAIEEAEVHISNLEMQTDDKQMTPYTGEYVFSDVTEAYDYAIKPVKTSDYANGISTLDLILIQQHILGTRVFDTPYKYIAADANDDRRVSSVDLVLLRRLILGHIAKFPGNDSWRFIPEHFEFDNPAYPWPFDESIILNHVDKSMTSNNFIGVKVGDLDQNAVANSRTAKGRTYGSKSLNITTASGSNGQQSYGIFVSEQSQAHGFQIAFTFDPATMEFKGIENGQVTVHPEQIKSEQGLVKLLWMDARGAEINTEEPLFQVIFDLRPEIDGQMTLDLAKWDNEWYDSDLASQKIEVGTVRDETVGLTLYQNKPNPFSEQTEIGFFLPESGRVDLDVFDVNGKKVFESSGFFGIGVNKVIIDRAQAGLSRGIYYYQLTTTSGIMAKKMIVI